MKRLLMMLPAAFVVAACSTEPTSSSDNPNTIFIDGSSTVYPISQEAAKRYLRKNKQASIDVKFSGTGKGFEEFCRGKTDINDASREINQSEKELCAQNGISYEALPLAIDTIAIVANPKSSWLNSLSTTELKNIWQQASEGKLTKWNQVRPNFPDEPIKLYGRAQGSGTFDYFTHAINGQTGNIRQDYTASHDEEKLASDIAKEKGSLGFFGIGAYHRHWQDLKLIGVDNGKGAVSPSLATAADGSYQPLTRPLFLYVNQKSLQEKSDLRPFLQHYYRNLRTWLHFTGYMPQSDATYQNVEQHLQ